MSRIEKPADSETARSTLRAGKPTLKTIAELTGLAITTVSRALANAPQISESTRRRVHEVAAEIGYLPDRAAQRLKTGRTNVISVLLDPHEEILGFGTSIMHGLARALQTTPYHLIVTPNFLDGSNVDAVNYIIRNGMADGLIFRALSPSIRVCGCFWKTAFPSLRMAARNSPLRTPSSITTISPSPTRRPSG